jgi:hypothetical protein
VRILQREKKSLQTVIRLEAVPISPEETAENGPICVQNHSQSVCVTVTSAVKFFCFETIATALPQNRKIASFGTLRRSPEILK